MVYQLKLNQKKKRNYSPKRLWERIDLWYRANVTQRAHWLKLYDKPIVVLDVDMAAELALVALAKRYLYEELGHISKYSNKDDENTFYRNFRMHSTNEAINIDICLNLIDCYSAKDIMQSERRVKAPRRIEVETNLTNAMVAFVRQRQSMWT